MQKSEFAAARSPTLFVQPLGQLLGPPARAVHGRARAALDSPGPRAPCMEGPHIVRNYMGRNGRNRVIDEEEAAGDPIMRLGLALALLGAMVALGVFVWRRARRSGGCAPPALATPHCAPQG
jgi:hypothetical protein